MNAIIILPLKAELEIAKWPNAFRISQWKRTGLSPCPLKTNTYNNVNFGSYHACQPSSNADSPSSYSKVQETAELCFLPEYQQRLKRNNRRQETYKTPVK